MTGPVPLRALLVGAGGWARNWARNLDRNADVILAGWVDLRPGVAASAARELDIPDIWTGEEVGAGILEVLPDFVVDAASPEAHYTVTMQALRSGLPVLGEKPLANTMDRARELVEASERAGTLFMVSQNRRYDPRLAAMRQLIVEQIGELGMLHADFSRAAHFGGFREEMPNPLLLDMAIHTFDAARYLSGADPRSVYCEEFNPPWSWYRGDACATAIFEMTGGLHFSYRGSWTAEGFPTPWEGQWRAVGPKGTVLWDGEHMPVAEVVAGEKGATERIEAFPPREIPRDIAGSLQDFVRALRTGAAPMGECHDNIKSLAMVFAAIESARRGQRVAVEM